MKILHVVGARPNFMKIAPIVAAMDEHPGVFEQLLVHTGQHYDRKMSKVFFEELGENICFGEAFKDWMEEYFTRKKGNNDYVDDYETKAWNYGYVVIGDPMVCFKEVPTAIEPDNTFSYKPDYSFKLTNKNSIKISYTLPNARFVSLRLYSMTGKCVATLVNTFHKRGQYSIDFSTGKMANGLYILGLDAGECTVSKKVKLVH